MYNANTFIKFVVPQKRIGAGWLVVFGLMLRRTERTEVEVAGLLAKDELRDSSIAAAGCISSVTTNPIWVVKTRLQLDREQKPTSLGNVIKQIAKEKGIRGFYLGLTASIYGISETVAHFVVYEHLKKRMSAWLGQRHDQHDMKHFLGFMACGALSKTGATCLAYPHGKLDISTPCISLFLSLSQKWYAQD